MADNLPGRPNPDAGVPVPSESSYPQLAGFGPLDPMGAPEEKSAGIGRYVSAILRYKWMIIGIVLLGVGVGVFMASRVRPTYVAQATVWIETGSRGSGRGVEEGPIQTDQLLESSAWESLLRTYEVLDHVVRQQRLYLDYGNPADSLLFASFHLEERFRPGNYTLTVSQDGRRYELKADRGLMIEAGVVGDSIGRAAGFDWQPPANTLAPGAEIAFIVTTPRDAAIRLADAIRIHLPERYGNFMSLELGGSNPTRIAATLNTVAERFVDVAGELKRSQHEERTALLEEQLRRAEENMSAAEMELERFRVQTITLPTETAPVTPGLEVTRDPAFESFFQLRTDREQLRRDQLAIRSALATQSESGETPVERLWSIGSVQNSADLKAALDEWTAKQADLRTLRSRFTDEHADVRRLTAEIETLETATIPTLARTLLSQLSQQEQALDDLIESSSEELREIPPRMIEEARLRRRMDIAENLHAEVQARYEAARLAAVSSVPDVRILDRATVPYQATNPGARTKALAMAIIAAMGLAIGGAILLDRVDRRVRYPQQVTSEIGLPILGAVQLAPPHDAGEQTEQVVEAFRELRLALMHAYGSAGPIILTITSPGSGDGKSFVSSNLALAFADLGYRTLIVDGDIRRGTLHHVLSGNRKPGLTDFLAGEVPQTRLIQETQYPNVHFIGAGAWRRSGPELLASPRMRALLAEMKAQYQVIIFDSSPLGAGVDPYVLGTLTGNLLMVLRTGATDRELAGAKLDALHRLPIRVLGAVLNAVPGRGVYKYYSYLSSYQLPPADEPTESEPVGA